jgi:hypothetical protein
MQAYFHAHIALKEAARAELKPYKRGKPIRYRPDDSLLAFLNAQWTAKLCRIELD